MAEQRKDDPAQPPVASLLKEASGLPLRADIRPSQGSSVDRTHVSAGLPKGAGAGAGAGSGAGPIVAVPATSASPDPVLSPGSSRSFPNSQIPQDKTVISKRAPASEPRPLIPLGGSLELGRSLEGRQLGHFRLEQFVGGGGMGAVFRASDTKLSRVVAVKVMARDRTDDDTLRRFQNEAQSAARLDHPNIARVHYVGEDEGLNYIVFEYIEGVNIRDHVAQNGPLPLEEAINYTLQVAEALEHAYQRDVVHRDIKPSNVLVMNNGHVKLVDMGLARMHQVEASHADLTATGVTLGTFDYISPEQARDPRSADVRSDLYSLGCTLYYMLTGRPVFPDGTVLQKLLSHSSEAPPDVRVYRPELSEDVSHVLQRLLAKQPAQRYQTPSELIGALLLLADGLGLDRVSRAGMVWVAPQDDVWNVLERQLPWAAPTLVFLALVIALRWGWTPASGQPWVPVRPSFVTVAAATNATPESAAENPPAESAERGETPAPATVRKEGERTGRAKESPSGATSPAPDKSAPLEFPPPSTKPESAASATSPNAAPDASRAPSTEGDGTSAPGLERPPLSPARASVNPANGSTPADAIAQPTVSGAKSADEGAPSAVLVRRLIVGDADDSAAEDPETRRFEQLHDAFRAAVELPGVESVELRFQGPRVTLPFDISLPSRRVTVRAGAGFAPRIVFRPETSEPVSDRRMIRVLRCSVTWEGVPIELELPNEPSDDWAVFYLDRAGRVEVNDATLTIREESSDVRVPQAAAFFRMAEPIAVETMMDMKNGRDPMPGLLGLRNCVARGPGCFVRAPSGIPFRLTWQQGLFASTGGLIDIQGARTQPQPSEVISVELSQVTMAIGRPLCLMRLDPETRFPLEFVGKFLNCIFLESSPAAADAAPLTLVEQQYAVGVEGARYRPYLSGAGNYYPDNTVLLRIGQLANREATQEYTLLNRHEARQEKWYDEQPSVGMVKWKKLPAPDLPVERQAKSDYQLDDTPDNPAGHAGFDPQQLPD